MHAKGNEKGSTMISTKALTFGAAYVSTSSAMLSMNGLAVKQFPCPAAIVLFQNAFAAVVLLAQRRFHLSAIMRAAGGFRLAMEVAVVFAIVLFSGMYPLVSVPVESVVVGRACGTGLVALAEYVHLAQLYSYCCIQMVSIERKTFQICHELHRCHYCCTCYQLKDLFHLWADNRVRWCTPEISTTYHPVFLHHSPLTPFLPRYADITIATVPNEMMKVYNVQVRAATTSQGADSIALGLTNNLFSLLPLGLIASRELSTSSVGWESVPWTALLLSTLFGFVISTAGLALRKLITATSFTVLANVNKLGTVVLAGYLRNEPLHPNAVTGLVMTLGGGAMYSLSPKGTR